ncbi:MAG: phosphoribosylformylglycinamidine cyclo-ligase [Candidatus Marinimicrobia bacterium]|nr:phosphoribosylformylglycinamidine cyclo-ligase [Candidatus Neomarinimicrobiota bacterium]
MIEKKIDYKSAGVDIDAGNNAVELIKNKVKSTFSEDVLTGIGSFGSLFSLKSVIQNYDDPVMVQSIDGVGTKTIIARKMKKFNTVGIDLVSACANDILVMGARPVTFLDYIANDRLNPKIVAEIVEGMVKACKETGVSLVGGETAEMPDTYLPGEHDLVGVITGIVDKNKIITGNNICPGDVLLGLPSSGLHTNGYSLARKVFFDIGKHTVETYLESLGATVGDTLLEPHINYTNHVLSVLENGENIKGIAHITGGGLTENIPRILPSGCSVSIDRSSWPGLPVFDTIKELGNIDNEEMYRAFNMGVGMVFIIDKKSSNAVANSLKKITPVYEIGEVTEGDNLTRYI